jgi:hypothetical protein
VLVVPGEVLGTLVRDVPAVERAIRATVRQRMPGLLGDVVQEV